MSLNTKALAHTAPIVYLAEVDSTNNIAAALGRQGTPDYTVVVAESQSAGRGRHGRVWQTFPLHSLAMSIVVYETDPSTPLVACLSLYKACTELGILGLSLKWPNDLMFGERKIAGMLSESYPSDDGKRRFLVLGCGINVTTPKDITMPEVAGALDMAVAQPVSREDVARAFLATLQKDIVLLGQKGFAAFVEDYKNACVTVGRDVLWKEAGRNVQGIATDITPEGAICLQTAQGLVQCHSGEMIIEK